MPLNFFLGAKSNFNSRSLFLVLASIPQTRREITFRFMYTFPSAVICKTNPDLHCGNEQYIGEKCATCQTFV